MTANIKTNDGKYKKISPSSIGLLLSLGLILLLITTTITNLINVHHHHCQVNITNQLGETPLHLAVENAKGSAGDENPTELVQFLVDR